MIFFLYEFSFVVRFIYNSHNKGWYSSKVKKTLKVYLENPLETHTFFKISFQKLISKFHFKLFLYMYKKRGGEFVIWILFRCLKRLEIDSLWVSCWFSRNASSRFHISYKYELRNQVNLEYLPKKYIMNMYCLKKTHCLLIVFF